MFLGAVACDPLSRCASGVRCESAIYTINLLVRASRMSCGGCAPCQINYHLHLSALLHLPLFPHFSFLSFYALFISILSLPHHFPLLHLHLSFFLQLSLFFPLIFSFPPFFFLCWFHFLLFSHFPALFSLCLMLLSSFLLLCLSPPLLCSPSHSCSFSLLLLILFCLPRFLSSISPFLICRFCINPISFPSLSRYLSLPQISPKLSVFLFLSFFWHPPRIFSLSIHYSLASSINPFVILYPSLSLLVHPSFFGPSASFLPSLFICSLFSPVIFFPLPPSFTVFPSLLLLYIFSLSTFHSLSLFSFLSPSLIHPFSLHHSFS